MNDLSLVRPAALKDIEVGISVSNSADLLRLGLEPRHAELAIGEIARAVLIAGGQLTYGGRVRPSGFTQQLMHEVRRYGESRHSLTICLAFPEHRKLALSELAETDRQLGTWGRLISLDIDGSPMDYNADRGEVGEDISDESVLATAFTALRQYMVNRTRAQVLVGGKLAGFRGSMPGLIEEGIAAVGSEHPVFFAGGFGGATAAAGRALDPSAFEWLPPGLPTSDGDVRVHDAIESLISSAQSVGWSTSDNGLDQEQNGMLAASHRPGEIASLVVLGLARVLGT